MHGTLCGALWDERGPDCIMTEGNLTEVGKKMAKSNGAVICHAIKPKMHVLHGTKSHQLKCFNAN